jgi:hypothetical protein
MLDYLQHAIAFSIALSAAEILTALWRPCSMNQVSDRSAGSFNQHGVPAFSHADLLTSPQKSISSNRAIESSGMPASETAQVLRSMKELGGVFLPSNYLPPLA